MESKFETRWNKTVDSIMALIPSRWWGHVILFLIIFTFIVIGISGITTIKNFIWPAKPSNSEILDLVKACKWGDTKEQEGDYASCKTIIDLAEEYKNDIFIQGQVNLIRRYYADLSSALRHPQPILESGDGKTYCMGGQLATKGLQPNSNYAWFTRAWGVYLLKSRQEKSVPKILIDIIQTDPSAVVRELAIDSYSKLSDYNKNEKVFNIDGAVKHFKDNKTDIIDKMKEDGSIIPEPCSYFTIEQLSNMGYGFIKRY